MRHRPKASVLVSQTQKQLDLENEEQQKRCQFYESNLERLGEIRKKIGNFTYVVSLCDPIMNISVLFSFLSFIYFLYLLFIVYYYLLLFILLFFCFLF